jgi:hypothetical protein
MEPKEACDRLIGSEALVKSGPGSRSPEQHIFRNSCTPDSAFSARQAFPLFVNIQIRPHRQIFPAFHFEFRMWMYNASVCCDAFLCISADKINHFLGYFSVSPYVDFRVAFHRSIHLPRDLFR